MERLEGRDSIAARMDSIADELREMAATAQRCGSNSLVMRAEGILSPSGQARELLRARKKLRQAMPPGLFEDPAFEMMLELFAVGEEGHTISVSSLCHCSGVPATTALRWITVLEREGLVVRSPDADDKRRVNLTLTPYALKVMRTWIDDLRSGPLLRSYP